MTASRRSRGAAGIVTKTVVGLEPAERPADLVEAADDPHALDPLPAEVPVVVDEPDDTLSALLAQLAKQATAAPAGADDEDAPLVAPADERRERTSDASFPEARGADEERAEQEIDEEHAARESVPGDRRPEEEERRCLRDEHRGEDARGVAGARVAPDAAVQAEDDEREIARDEHRRQGDVEDVAHPRRALALHADRVRGGERRR